ncbi:Septin-2 [Anabarilius grahami]|uniref:Septin-2 n=1 Tax=Anabarilius grahami TaxID=495550 RepID=A0A3N0XLH7_ANAGA|nr:Septin-2 [Anabarilius grahami]
MKKLPCHCSRPDSRCLCQSCGGAANPNTFSLGERQAELMIVLRPLNVKVYSFKRFYFVQILDEINEQGIRIYQLPDADSDEDEEFKEQTRVLKASIPFAVIGSNQLIEVKGKKIRGRLYPWGVVELRRMQQMIAQMQAQMKMKPGDD